MPPTNQGTGTIVLDFYKDHPERWTKDAMARDAIGNQLDREDPDAECYCLHGAILVHYRSQSYQPLAKVQKVLEKRGLHMGIIIDFNDDPATSFQDVISILEEAQV